MNTKEIDDVNAPRRMLGISQMRLARLAGVSRYRLCLSERGDLALNATELLRIRNALQQEATRLRDDLAVFGEVGA